MVSVKFTLMKNQYRFLEKITTIYKDWFVLNFGELTLTQMQVIMIVVFYTDIERNLLNHIRERYIEDLQQKKI